MPEALAARLEGAGVGFYRWSSDGARVLVRLVTSFATPMAHVEALLRLT